METDFALVVVCPVCDGLGASSSVTKNIVGESLEISFGRCSGRMPVDCGLWRGRESGEVSVQPTVAPCWNL